MSRERLRRKAQPLFLCLALVCLGVFSVGCHHATGVEAESGAPISNAEQLKNLPPDKQKKIAHDQDVIKRAAADADYRMRNGRPPQGG